MGSNSSISYKRLLEEELKEKDCLLNQGEIEILNVKAKEKTKRQLEREKLKKELDRYKQVESQLQRQTERFLVMRDLLDAGCSVKVPGSAGSSESDTRTPSLGAKHRVSDPKLVGTPSLRVGKPDFIFLFVLKHKFCCYF